MGGGRWKQHPRSGVRETLERLEAQESIEAAGRVTPHCSQRTLARCQALEPSSFRSKPCACVWGRSRLGSRSANMGRKAASRSSGATDCVRCDGGRDWRVNGKRVADVERRHGFVEAGK